MVLPRRRRAADGKQANKNFEQRHLRVNLTSVLLRISVLETNKSFVLSLMFLITYVTLNTVRIDFGYAHATHERYLEARRVLHVPAFEDYRAISGIADFLDTSIPAIAASLHATQCRNCGFGITKHRTSLSSIGLEEFACSDFLSTAGSSKYPSRDCPAADAEYAMHPSAEHAPCCTNVTLIKASMSMMVWKREAPELLRDGFLTPGPVTVEDLVTIDDMFVTGPPEFGQRVSAPEDLAIFQRVYEGSYLNAISATSQTATVEAGSLLFATRGVTSGFIAQLIISRDERMLGMELNAHWLDRANAKGYVEASVTYWSYNFKTSLDGNSHLWVLVLFTYLICCFTMVHDATGYYMRWTSRAALLQSLQGPRVWIKVLGGLSLVLSEACTSSMRLPTWSVWVAVNELLLAGHVFVDGKHLKPFRLIVVTITHAASTLFNVMLVLLTLTFLTSIVAGQLFGMFDPSLEMYTFGLTSTFRYLVSPPSLDSTHMRQSESGAMLVFYWTMALIRLTLGSLTIAVLVGSFNAVRTQGGLELKCEEQRIPSGYAKAFITSGAPTPKWLDMPWYLLTGRVFGLWMPTLCRRVLKLRDAADARDAEASELGEAIAAEEEHYIVSQDELARVVGEASALKISRRFGIVRQELLAKGHTVATTELRSWNSTTGDANRDAVVKVASAAVPGARADSISITTAAV